MVAVLCVAKNSVYKTLPGVDAYDAARDARTFAGGMPVVAHPPCRSWSRHCRHQAKNVPQSEIELGLWCCDVLRECGGVLEQPAGSHLFAAGGLPQPGAQTGELWTAEVWQAWWGYSVRKATWLCFSRVPQDAVEFPLRLHAPGRDRRRVQVMSHNQRSATTREFASWLVDVAGRAS